MATNDDVKNPKDEKDIADNDNAGADNDTTEGNSGVQDKPDDVRVKTVTPDNDNDDQVASDSSSSNKGQGPSGENL